MFENFREQNTASGTGAFHINNPSPEAMQHTDSTLEDFQALLREAGIGVFAYDRDPDPYAKLMVLISGMVHRLKQENASLKSRVDLDAEDSELFDIWRENHIRHPDRLDKFIGQAETPDDVKDGLIALRRAHHSRKGKA